MDTTPPTGSKPSVPLSPVAARTLVEITDLVIYCELSSGEQQVTADRAREAGTRLLAAARLLDAGHAGQVDPRDLEPLLADIRNTVAEVADNRVDLGRIEAGDSDRRIDAGIRMGETPDAARAAVLTGIRHDLDLWGHQVAGGRELIELAEAVRP